MTNKLDKIRIGNDINVLPELTAGGEPVTWRDDVAKVMAFSVAQRQGVELETSVVDGVLQAYFRAEQQRWLGIYHVVVVLKDGNTATWDKPAFELVATTAEADVETGMAVVRIQGELTVVTGGTGVWGRILGDIMNQQDLIELIESRQYDDTELREAIQEAMRLIDTKASAEAVREALERVYQILNGKADRSELPVVPYDEISANSGARHTHDNKSILDGITAGKVSSWDGKQDSIGDLEQIRQGSGKGATALQPQALNAYRTAQAQDAIDATKAGTEYVNTELAKKADKTYVDGQLQTKASSAELTELSRKVDSLVVIDEEMV